MIKIKKRYIPLMTAIILSMFSCATKPSGPWTFEEYSEQQWKTGIRDTPLGTAASAEDSLEWELTFYDEFDGSRISTDDWKIISRDEDDRYHQNNSVLEEGKLILSVNEIDGELRAGRIDSRHSFSQKYGVFEVRARLDEINDTIFAFWMSHYPGVNNVGNGGRDGSEIDIIETGYQDNAVIHTFHWDGYEKDHRSHSTAKLPIGINIHEGWHIYGISWTEDTVSFYVDGIKTASYSGEGVPRVPEFLILSSEVNKHWEGRLADAELPVRYEVDWVRGYTRK